MFQNFFFKQFLRLSLALTESSFTLVTQKMNKKSKIFRTYVFDLKVASKHLFPKIFPMGNVLI